LDGAGVLLANELDSGDNLGAGVIIKLFSGIGEDGGEDWDELGSEGDDAGDAMLVCISELVIAQEPKRGHLHKPAMHAKIGAFSS
jgi:hypothetical protein